MKRILALAVALAACSGGWKNRTDLETPEVVRGPATEAEPGQLEYAGAPECVVAAPGVAVTTREISGGIALALTGGPAREGEVRELGRSIASTVQHDRGPAEPPSPESPGELEEPPSPERSGELEELGLPGEEPSADVADVAPTADSDGTVDPAAMRGYEIEGDQHIAVDAATEDVSGGVEVILTAKLAGDIDPLRDVVRAFAERLRSGECPDRVSARES